MSRGANRQRFTRASLAIALIVAGAALPLMLTACDVSCQAARVAAASLPTCHHSSLAASRIAGHAPGSCRHDEHRIVQGTPELLGAREAFGVDRMLRVHGIPATTELDHVVKLGRLEDRGHIERSEHQRSSSSAPLRI